MIKRTVEVSSEPAHLTARLDQLLIQRDGQTVDSIPCEDIGMLVVDQPQTTYSQAALAGLARFDAVLVVCGRDHLPAAMLLPLADHHEVVWRMAEQAAVSKPMRKRLWKQLVRAKIRAQALNLAADSPPRKKLLALARQVRSGDPANVEAHAAQVYWRHWIEPQPDPFGSKDGTGRLCPRRTIPPRQRRRRSQRHAQLRLCDRPGGFGPGVGRRGTSARPRVVPREPFKRLLSGRRFNGAASTLGRSPRPGTASARAFSNQYDSETPRNVSSNAVEPSVVPSKMGCNERGPLMVNLHRMTASLVRCYEGRADRLEIPLACTLADTDVCGS